MFFLFSPWSFSSFYSFVLPHPTPPVGTLLLSLLRRHQGHYDPGQKKKKEKGKEEKETSVRASARQVTGSGVNLCFKTFSSDCL